jgi:hypothetical protein
MRSFEIGVVLPIVQHGADRGTPGWSVVPEMFEALGPVLERLEAVGDLVAAAAPDATPA